LQNKTVNLKKIKSTHLDVNNFNVVSVTLLNEFFYGGFGRRHLERYLPKTYSNMISLK